MIEKEKQEMVVYSNEIKALILTVRGKQVLLDSDVARLYGYETKAINQAASRNKDRFPPEFRFRLTSDEFEEVLRSQIVTLNKSTDKMRAQDSEDNIVKLGQGEHRKYQPYAYTEQGIGMLSGILKNKTAVQVSIGIMNAFVEMRQFLNVNKDIYAKLVNLDNRILEHDYKFDQVFDLLQASEDSPKQSIFYKGQFYDAFKFVVDIIAQVKNHIIIIDNYLDDSVFEMLANKQAEVKKTLITSNPGRLSQLHLNKFSKQYGPISVVTCKDFHDRFVILDDREVYAFGASLKDLGNKCFEVSKNEDTIRFVSYVNEVINAR